MPPKKCAGTLAVQRINDIKTLMLEQKSMTVSALSEHFGVTYETIRRDLEALEKEGFLRKVYGGAALNVRVQNEVDFATLVGLFSESKQLIAQKAANFIRQNDCIYLDASTTAYHIISEIVDRNLTVMTNSLKALSKLSESPSINVVALGGTLNRLSFSFQGASTCSQLSNFHLDKAFISCNALDRTYGLSDKGEESATLHKAIMESSNEVFLVVDHTKFDKISFAKFADFKKVKAVITDHPLSEEWTTFLRENKIAWY